MRQLLSYRIFNFPFREPSTWRITIVVGSSPQSMNSYKTEQLSQPNISYMNHMSLKPRDLSNAEKSKFPFNRFNNKGPSDPNHFPLAGNGMINLTLLDKQIKALPKHLRDQMYNFILDTRVCHHFLSPHPKFGGNRRIWACAGCKYTSHLDFKLIQLSAYLSKYGKPPIEVNKSEDFKHLFRQFRPVVMITLPTSEPLQELSYWQNESVNTPVRDDVIWLTGEVRRNLDIQLHTNLGGAWCQFLSKKMCLRIHKADIHHFRQYPCALYYYISRAHHLDTPLLPADVLGRANLSTPLNSLVEGIIEKMMPPAMKHLITGTSICALVSSLLSTFSSMISMWQNRKTLSKLMWVLHATTFLSSISTFVLTIITLANLQTQQDKVKELCTVLLTSTLNTLAPPDLEELTTILDISPKETAELDSSFTKFLDETWNWHMGTANLEKDDSISIQTILSTVTGGLGLLLLTLWVGYHHKGDAKTAKGVLSDFQAANTFYTTKQNGDSILSFIGEKLFGFDMDGRGKAREVVEELCTKATGFLTTPTITYALDTKLCKQFRDLTDTLERHIKSLGNDKANSSLVSRLSTIHLQLVTKLTQINEVISSMSVDRPETIGIWVNGPRDQGKSHFIQQWLIPECAKQLGCSPAVYNLPTQNDDFFQPYFNQPFGLKEEANKDGSEDKQVNMISLMCNHTPFNFEGASLATKNAPCRLFATFYCSNLQRPIFSSHMPSEIKAAAYSKLYYVNIKANNYVPNFERGQQTYKNDFTHLDITIEAWNEGQNEQTFLKPPDSISQKLTPIQLRDFITSRIAKKLGEYMGKVERNIKSYEAVSVNRGDNLVTNIENTLANHLDCLLNVNTPTLSATTLGPQLDAAKRTLPKIVSPTLKFTKVKQQPLLATPVAGPSGVRPPKGPRRPVLPIGRKGRGCLKHDPYVLHINGPTGVGKTTYASRIANHLKSITKLPVKFIKNDITSMHTIPAIYVLDDVITECSDEKDFQVYSTWFNGIPQGSIVILTSNMNLPPTSSWFKWKTQYIQLPFNASGVARRIGLSGYLRTKDGTYIDSIPGFKGGFITMSSSHCVTQLDYDGMKFNPTTHSLDDYLTKIVIDLHKYFQVCEKVLVEKVAPGAIPPGPYDIKIYASDFKHLAHLLATRMSIINGWARPTSDECISMRQEFVTRYQGASTILCWQMPYTITSGQYESVVRDFIRQLRQNCPTFTMHFQVGTVCVYATELVCLMTGAEGASMTIIEDAVTNDIIYMDQGHAVLTIKPDLAAKYVVEGMIGAPVEHLQHSAMIIQTEHYIPSVKVLVEKRRSELAKVEAQLIAYRNRSLTSRYIEEHPILFAGHVLFTVAATGSMFYLVSKFFSNDDAKVKKLDSIAAAVNRQTGLESCKLTVQDDIAYELSSLVDVFKPATPEAVPVIPPPVDTNPDFVSSATTLNALNLENNAAGGSNTREAQHRQDLQIPKFNPALLRPLIKTPILPTTIGSGNVAPVFSHPTGLTYRDANIPVTPPSKSNFSTCVDAQIKKVRGNEITLNEGGFSVQGLGLYYNYAVTVAHLFPIEQETFNTVACLNRNGHQYKVRVLARDLDRDLALIQLYDGQGASTPFKDIRSMFIDISHMQQMESVWLTRTQYQPKQSYEDSEKHVSYFSGVCTPYARTNCQYYVQKGEHKFTQTLKRDVLCVDLSPENEVSFLKTWMPTGPGDCGRPYLSILPRSSGIKIVGIHCASINESKLSIGSILTASDIAEMMFFALTPPELHLGSGDLATSEVLYHLGNKANVQVPIILDDYALELIEQPTPDAFTFAPPGNFTVLGKSTIWSPCTNYKSQYQRSPCTDDINFPELKIPASHSVEDFPEKTFILNQLGKPDMAMTVLQKHATKPLQSSHELFNKVYEMFWRDMLRKGNSNDWIKEPLDANQVLNGCGTYFNPIEIRASAGLHASNAWCAEHKTSFRSIKKREFVDVVEIHGGSLLKWKDTPSAQEVLKRLAYIDSNARVKQRVFTCCQDRLKDEKIKAGKLPRMFYNVDFCEGLFFRRWVGPFIDAFMSSKLQWHAIGMDPIEDFTSLQKQLMQDNQNSILISLDWVNFDGRAPPQGKRMFISMLKKFWELVNENIEKLDNILCVLEAMSVDPIHLNRNVIYASHNGTLSGFVATTIENTMDSAAMALSSLIKVMQEFDLLYPFFRLDMDYLPFKFCALGDDFFIRLDASQMFVVEPWVQKIKEMWEMDVTVTVVTNWNRAIFLSRYFLTSGYYINAGLKHISIYSLIAWTISPDLEQIWANWKLALDEAIVWGDTFYVHIRSIIDYIYGQMGSPPMRKLPTMQETKSIFFCRRSGAIANIILRHRPYLQPEQQNIGQITYGNLDTGKKNKPKTLLDLSQTVENGISVTNNYRCFYRVHSCAIQNSFLDPTTDQYRIAFNTTLWGWQVALNLADFYFLLEKAKEHGLKSLEVVLPYNTQNLFLHSGDEDLAENLAHAINPHFCTQVVIRRWTLLPLYKSKYDHLARADRRYSCHRPERARVLPREY